MGNSVVYSMDFETPPFKNSPQILIEKISINKPPAIPDKIYKNPQGVSYVVQSSSRLFFGTGFYVDINLNSAPSDPSFSQAQFMKMVIETFKIDSFIGSDVLAKAEYGKKVKYELNKAIEFPDFTLKYTGTTKAPGSDNVKWSVVDYNFEVKTQNGVKTISWTSGTGDMGPKKFTVFTPPFSIVSEWTFYLELQKSIKYAGNLKDNELVVLSKEQFSEKF